MLPHENKLHGVGDKQYGVPFIQGESTGSTLRTWLKQACLSVFRKAALYTARIHDHRHSAAVSAWSMNVDPIVVSYGLGHASFEITKRIYAQTVPLLSSEFSDVLGNVLSPEEGLPRVNDGGGINVQ